LFLIVIQVYDGVRRRALPVLFDALKPGVDDDRMKGALWTVNMSDFGKYAICGRHYQSGTAPHVADAFKQSLHWLMISFRGSFHASIMKRYLLL